MPAPLGFLRRNDAGLRGRLARWWYQRRVSEIKAALAREQAEQRALTATERERQAADRDLDADPA